MSSYVTQTTSPILNDQSSLLTTPIEYLTKETTKSSFVEFKLSGPYILVLVVYMSICVIGLAGNLSVIYIILRFPKMKTVTNQYILNLAIADVMFLTGIPFLVTTMVLMRWPFGYVVCKAYWITANVNQFVSSAFYLVLSGDRFVAVYLALTAGRKYRRPDIARTVCACIWTFATLIMIPIMRHARTVVVSRNVAKGEDIYSCQVVWPEPMMYYSDHSVNGTRSAPKRKFSFDANKAFTLYTFAFGYGIPVLLTVIFYFFVLVRLKKSGPKHTSMGKTKQSKMSLNSLLSYLLCRSKPLNLLSTNSNDQMVDDTTESKLSLVRVPSIKNSALKKSKFEKKDDLSEVSFINHSNKKIRKDSEICYNTDVTKLTATSDCHKKLLEEPSTTHNANAILNNSAQKKRKKKGIRKVTIMVMTIITVYVSCWTPYWVLQLILGFRNKPMPPHTIYVSMFVYCLAYANSCMNPILYAFLSENFKVGFQKMFSSPCLQLIRSRLASINPFQKSANKDGNSINKASSKKLPARSPKKSFYNPEGETSFFIPNKETGKFMSSDPGNSVIDVAHPHVSSDIINPNFLHIVAQRHKPRSSVDNNSQDISMSKNVYDVLI